jgi:hypothetical protein
MATLVSPPHWGRLIGQGLIAGIVGGTLMNVFIVVAQHISIVNFWQFVASSAVGQVAYSSTSYAWLGLLFHAIVSIAWATGYAYVAATRPNVMATPWLSGIVFGAVVWLIMEVVLVFDKLAGPLTGPSIAMGLIAVCAFYGIPVALTVRALARRT